MMGPRARTLILAAPFAVAACRGAGPAASRTLGAAPSPAAEYVAPSGTRYYARPDTGAIARAESALALGPRNVDLLIRLGLAQAAGWRYREAIATYTRAIALAPDSVVLYRHRGHRYISVREFGRALRDLERGARLDSASYDIWYHLGLARYLRGAFSPASAAFARAQRLARTDANVVAATDWLWMSLRRAGRAAEAEAALAPIHDSMQVAADDAYYRRLRLYRGQIRPEEVVAAADTSALALATLGYGVGNWHLVHGDSVRAKEWFERVVHGPYWPAFGFIASEVELARMR